MHGSENFKSFSNGIGVDEVSIGQNISKIYEVRYDLSLPMYLAYLLSGYLRWQNAECCLFVVCLSIGCRHGPGRHNTKKNMASTLRISLVTFVLYTDGRVE